MPEHCILFCFDVNDSVCIFSPADLNVYSSRNLSIYTIIYVYRNMRKRATDVYVPPLEWICDVELAF